MNLTEYLGIIKLEAGARQPELVINSALKILAASIAGELPVVTTGGTTTLSGTSSDPEAQNIFLNISGTLTSNATIEIPVAAGTGRNRLYIVKNGTTGNFSVTIKKVGGTGVELTQGITSFVMFDGSDMVFVLGGPSVSWTPTWTNLSVGNGTVVARFTKIGKIILCRISLVFGSSTSVSGSVSFSLPVTRAAYGGTGGVTPLGLARLFDTSSGDGFEGTIVNSTTTTAAIIAYDATATYVKRAFLSSTVPFSWATGDEIAAEFFYEAA